MIAEGSFGRPQDKDIEKQFMKKIRGDKLQAINAQCQLQIILAFRSDSKKQGKTKNKRSKKKDLEENNDNMEHLIQAMPIGGLNISRRQSLHEGFKLLKQAWKFQEILENEPLPDYFFEDGCDLSYILYELQKKDEQQFGIFSAEDLIFLELLCLSGRKLLNENIIKQYSDNMEYMIAAMNNGLEKVKERQRLYQVHAATKSKERKISNEEGVEVEYQSSFDQGNNTESKQQKKTKTKKIKKGAKGKKGKKNNESQSQEEEQEQNSESSKDYPKQKELALKTCNYISWAYWYIIKKE